jgi:hypothetical protein
MFFAPLKMIDGELDQLSSSQPASQQNCQHGPIPLALQCLCVGHLPEHASLIRGQPVSESHS